MELWTQEHAKTLPAALAVMVVAAVILRVTIGKKDIKIRMIPFHVLTCLLLLLEVGKQGISLYRGYDLYHLPFHFCSLFIFMMPAMSFYHGKYKEQVRGITAALCTAVFLLLMIYPNLIYSAANVNEFFTDYMSFHTVVFHNIVMFAFLLIPMLELHTPESKKEPRAVVLFTVCFCAVSATMAQLLKTNYANYYSCNIPILETVRLQVEQALGAIAAKGLYILIVSALNIVFVFGSYWLYRLLRQLVSKWK